MLSRNSIVTLVLWFLFSAVGGLSGFFATTKDPPVALGLAVVLPVALFVFYYLKRGKLYQQLRELDLRFLVLPQTWRVMGLFFLVDLYRGLLPAGFALPAGLGDIAIGVTAPLVAYLIRSNSPHKQAVYVAWNVLGIIDLVLAVTLGILHSQSTFGILAGGTTTALMSVFPRNLVPTFLVPLFVILHIAALSRFREVQQTGNRASAVTG